MLFGKCRIGEGVEGMENTTILTNNLWKTTADLGRKDNLKCK